jgi:hypothetical protein
MNLDDENMIRQGFEEFIKLLQLLASPAEKQMRPETALSTPAEDMESEFEAIYTVMMPRFKRIGLVNREQEKLLKDLFDFLEGRMDDYEEEFFAYEAPALHPGWEIVRQKSKAALLALSRSL